ncbi:MAG: acyl-CoA dehydrogenase family protein [Planctomycetes bacterium]|nr:acyl-CoA dehydrogenase family protein [Planctomycetota bacterium]
MSSTPAARVTHEVTNQVPPLADHDALACDPALGSALERYGAGWAHEAVTAAGLDAGSQRLAALGEEANRNPPRLVTYSRTGEREDRVDFHPAYHELMANQIRHGAHNLTWTEEGRPGASVARGAIFYLLTQPEQGVSCPISMTHAVVPSLRNEPELAAEWWPRIASREYDPSFQPANQKTGATLGMAMTEKQGGSDVRANSTQAESIGEGAYLLRGHKWFCSAPMCDAFLTLAQAPGGLTCFLVPRWRPDGTKNNFFIQRLKDKLGNRSNASSEIEYDQTWAQRIGGEGRGVPTIIEMVHSTRVDVTLGSAGIMRTALVQALHHTRHRSAFGKRLIEQPLMRNVLADLALESEAATVLAFRVAAAAGSKDPAEQAFGRVATAVAKYWNAKRVIRMVSESLECFGGNGYVEDTPLARLYREAPLGSIWEGSGNVQCLDVLRAARRNPDAVEAFLAELESTRGQNPLLDTSLDDLTRELNDVEDMELRARDIVERMATALQASLLVRHAPSAVSDAFCAGRLGRHGHEFGTLPRGLDLDAILTRVFPGA